MGIPHALFLPDRNPQSNYLDGAVLGMKKEDRSGSVSWSAFGRAKRNSLKERKDLFSRVWRHVTINPFQRGAKERRFLRNIGGQAEEKINNFALASW